MYINPNLMKTAQIVIRDLNGLPVRQNHKSGMFNATDLLNIYNERNPKEPKFLHHYLANKATTEYIDYLATILAEENTRNSGELEFSFPDEARPGSIIMTKRGKYGGTWMQQHLFIDFAMWLSLPFKHWAISCVGDKLIKLRDSAGESFKEVNAALTAIHGEQRQPIYIQEAKMINALVFEDGKGGHRNEATEEELSLLDHLQKADIKLIYAGHSEESRRKNLKIFKSLF